MKKGYLKKALIFLIIVLACAGFYFINDSFENPDEMADRLSNAFLSVITIDPNNSSTSIVHIEQVTQATQTTAIQYVQNNFIFSKNNKYKLITGITLITFDITIVSISIAVFCVKKRLLQLKP